MAAKVNAADGFEDFSELTRLLIQQSALMAARLELVGVSQPVFARMLGVSAASGSV